MKLKGVLVSLPVCDWRYFLKPENPASRLSSISPYSFELRKTFIPGFGVAEERPNLRAPWRPAETVFFDCSRALRLPEEARLLPDGSPVVNVVRRVYLDNGALVRFEFGLFDNAKHHYPYSNRPLHEYARLFWETPVFFAENRQQHRESVATVLPKLVRKFEQATSQQDMQSNNALCVPLEPQIQVIAEIAPHNMNENATMIDGDRNIWVAVRSLKLRGHPNPIDTIYVMYAHGYLEERFKPRFELLRLVRRQSGWLHSDLAILAHILKKTVRSEVEPATIGKYILELAQGLRNAPHRDKTVRLILVELTKFFADFNDNRVSLLLSAVDISALPDDLKRDLRIALHYSGR